MQTKKILVNDLVEGMIAHNNVYTDTGNLIYSAGFIINQAAIGKLILYDIHSILVDIPDEINYVNTSTYEIPNIINKNKIEEFHNFVKTYEETSNISKNSIDSIVNGKTIQQDILSSLSSNMIKNISTNKDLFDFLAAISKEELIYEHCLNVSVLCRTFGKWLHMSNKQIEDLAIAGLLHDIGKINVPQEILNKPNKLSATEMDEIKKHPIYSYRILEGRNLNDDIMKAILMHHERMDGSGYPTKAKGDQISLYARILAIADCYEAMTSARAYRQKICPFKVIEALSSEGVNKFDYSIINTILDNIANTYIGYRVRLNTDEEGEVMFINSRDLARPIIDIMGQAVDLSKEKDLYIEEILY